MCESQQSDLAVRVSIEMRACMLALISLSPLLQQLQGQCLSQHTFEGTLFMLLVSFSPSLFPKLLKLYVPSMSNNPTTSILSGEGWVQELLNGHPGRIWCELGITKNDFRLLILELQSMGHTGSRYASLEEQLAIFFILVLLA